MTESSHPLATIEQLSRFAMDTVRGDEFTGALLDMIEERLAALEEVTAAPWPRRWLLRRRLGRQLEASAATYAWNGDSWRNRRTDAVADDLSFRLRARRERRQRAS